MSIFSHRTIRPASIAFAGALLLGVTAGPYKAYLWWGTTSTFFAMITFVFVNLAVDLLYAWLDPRIRFG